MAALMSIAVLCGIALIAGGGWMLATRRGGRRGWLMIAAGALALFNLWSWGGLPITR